MTFLDLLTVALSATGFHNVLRTAGVLVVNKLTKIEGDVAAGNVPALVSDAKGVAAFVETHDPAAAKAVEGEADKLKASAEAEVAKVREAAANELKSLAESLSKATGAVASAPASAAPSAPSTPSVS